MNFQSVFVYMSKKTKYFGTYDVRVKHFCCILASNHNSYNLLRKQTVIETCRYYTTQQFNMQNTFRIKNQYKIISPVQPALIIMTSYISWYFCPQYDSNTVKLQPYHQKLLHSYNRTD